MYYIQKLKYGVAPKDSLWKLHVDFISISKSTISIEKMYLIPPLPPLQLIRIDRLLHKNMFSILENLVFRENLLLALI